MRQKIYLLLLLLGVSVCGFAQDKVGQDPRCLFEKNELGIEWQIPEGFSLLNESNILYGVNYQKSAGKTSAGYAYWMAAEANNGECLLLYPYDVITLDGVKSLSKGGYFVRNIIADELVSAFKGGMKIHEQSVIEPDWLKYITTIVGAEAQKKFNADTVYVVEYPLVNPYKDKYSHSIGLFLTKQGRYPTFVKCLLTDAGYQKRDEAFEALCKTIRYIGGEWNYDKEKINSEYDKVQKLLKASKK